MGQNDMQCLAEAICLHMLPLMSMLSIMGNNNEVHLVMREALYILLRGPVRSGTGWLAVSLLPFNISSDLIKLYDSQETGWERK